MPARGATEFPWSVFIIGVSVLVVVVFGFLMYFLRHVEDLENPLENQDNPLENQDNPDSPDDPDSRDDQPETNTTLLGWLFIIGVVASVGYTFYSIFKAVFKD